MRRPSPYRVSPIASHCLATHELRAGLMKLIYTYTDEAPALATHSFLPIIEAFAGQAGVDIELRDISLAGRILAQFPDRLTDDQRVADALAELGELAKTPEANIIKLPNISASIPQLKAAIKELQDAGLRRPGLPGLPVHGRGARRARGLRPRQGLRGQPGPARGQLRPPRARVGEGVRAQAPALDGRLVEGLQVARLDDVRRRLPLDRAVGDDRRRRRAADRVRGRRRRGDRAQGVRSPVLAGEIVDAAVMRRAALDAFLAEQIADAKEQGVLFSLHMKATMMKVSDPIIFGHAVRAFFAGRVHRARRRAGRREPEQRAGERPDRDRRLAAARGDRGRDRADLRDRSRRWRWSTPTAGSRTCTSRAT